MALPDSSICYCPLAEHKCNAVCSAERPVPGNPLGILNRHFYCLGAALTPFCFTRV